MYNALLQKDANRILKKHDKFWSDLMIDATLSGLENFPDWFTPG